MESRIAKYAPAVAVLLAVAPNVITKFFFEGTLTEWFGPDFPYGWVTISALTYLVGTKIADILDAIGTCYYSWGVHFRVRSMVESNGGTFRHMNVDNKNYLALAVGIENISSKYLSNIEVMAKVMRHPEGQPNNADPMYGIRLKLHDGTSTLNPRTSKVVILAHQCMDNHEMAFGEPEDPGPPIVANMSYGCILEISGNGSNVKQQTFVIDAYQSQEPVMYLREITYDD